MKRLKGYLDFIFESVLLTSLDFKKILKSIDDDTARDLHDLIDKDIKTNYNILDITDKNDTISFLSDTQSTTKLKSIPLEEIFNIKNNKTSIGRITKSILNDNGIKKTDREIEIFVNKFKSAYDSKFIKKDKIRIVEGEEIRYWYLIDNYTSSCSGTLGKSCMRHEECQEYFDIYVKNPSVCKLLIKVDDDNKLEARALFWETNKGKYLDRIYYSKDSDEDLLLNWVKNKYGEIFSFYNNRYEKLEVQLEYPHGYSTYPYMDSFLYIYLLNYKLYNYQPDIDKKRHLYLIQDTSGGAESQDMIYCEYEGESYPSDEVVRNNMDGTYLHSDHAEWSSYYSTYFPKEYAVFSKIANSFLPSRNSIQVKIGDNGEYDYYPDDGYKSEDYKYCSVTGEYYLNHLLFEYKGEFYSKEYVCITYEVKGEGSKIKYRSIYNNERYICTILDEDIFGFSLDKEDPIINSYSSYYYSTYDKIVHKDMISLLESIKDVDKELISKKIEEVNGANRHLSNYSTFYQMNNLFHDKFDGKEENLIKWYQNLATEEKFKKYYKEYENSIDYWGQIEDIMFNNFKSPFEFYGKSIYSNYYNDFLNQIKERIKKIGIYLLPSHPDTNYSNCISKIINSFLLDLIRDNRDYVNLFHYYMGNKSKFVK